MAMSGGGLAKDRLERLHDVMAAYVDRGAAPGLVVVVSRRGETHVGAIGAQAVGGDDPMADDTIFRISSMSKPITAIATLILLEETVLALDDPVERWLPELANRRVLRAIDGPLDDTEPAHRPITVRDLLTFRLGFGLVMTMDPYPILVAAAERGLGIGPPGSFEVPDPDTLMRNLGELPLMYQPGERWLYNTGSEVLSVLVARASGQPFEVFLRDRIFDPLGMVDTGFSVPAGKRSRFATSYTTDPESGALELFDAPDGKWSAPPVFPSGAGGLVSTAGDYVRFARMLLDGGRTADGTRIVSRPSIAAMTTDQLTPAQKAVSAMVPGSPFWDDHGWGFGVAVVTHRSGPTETPGKYGWDGGMGTTWSNDPTEDLITILLTQAAWSSPVMPAVALAFQAAAYAAVDD
jgi:CubicO group peptidase (beta-lactamase class C family)